MHETQQQPTTPEQPRKSWAPRPYIVVAMLVLGVLSIPLAYFAEVPHRFRPKPKVKEGPENLAPEESRIALPDFTLTERSGKAVSLKDLKGKTWVAAFVFTRCTMGCPSVTSTMKRLQTELNIAGRDDLVLVTITVDPERDGLQDLKDYAKKFDAHESKWLFLTGTEEVVRPLLKEGFKVTADRKKDGKPGDEYDHTTKLAVIDKQGRLCNFFDGMKGEHDTTGARYEQSLKALTKLVEQLVNEP